jgi:prepilin-type N-terminal cleavage/methylation domain-containing protein
MLLRKAFTLLEIIFAIVILGILASIGSEIISKIYQNYLYSKGVSFLETETAHALDIIAKRLQYKIDYSMILREINSSTGNPTTSIIFANMADPNKEYVLEWIGYDYDSFRGIYDSTKNSNIPGWSGFVDIDNNETNLTQIITPGSKLISIAEPIMNALSFGAVSLIDATKEKPALLYREIPVNLDINSFGWNKGYNGSGDYNHTEKVKALNEITLSFLDSKSKRTIFEQYYLSFSAYAVKLDKNTNELILYYNYRPWYAQKYTDGNQAILLNNTSTWKILKIDKTLRLKLCAYKQLSKDDNITVCKEKVVY